MAQLLLHSSDLDKIMHYLNNSKTTKHREGLFEQAGRLIISNKSIYDLEKSKDFPNHKQIVEQFRILMMKAKDINTLHRFLQDRKDDVEIRSFAQKWLLRRQERWLTEQYLGLFPDDKAMQAHLKKIRGDTPEKDGGMNRNSDVEFLELFSQLVNKEKWSSGPDKENLVKLKELLAFLMTGPQPVLDFVWAMAQESHGSGIPLFSDLLSKCKFNAHKKHPFDSVGKDLILSLEEEPFSKPLV